VFPEKTEYSDTSNHRNGLRKGLHIAASTKPDPAHEIKAYGVIGIARSLDEGWECPNPQYADDGTGKGPGEHQLVETREPKVCVFSANEDPNACGNKQGSDKVEVQSSDDDALRC